MLSFELFVSSSSLLMFQFSAPLLIERIENDMHILLVPYKSFRIEILCIHREEATAQSSPDARSSHLSPGPQGLLCDLATQS